jgi:hypothetical protein
MKCSSNLFFLADVERYEQQELIVFSQSTHCLACYGTVGLGGIGTSHISQR